MRVLFLCHRYHDINIGGVAEVLQYLPPALKKLGTTIIVYTAARQFYPAAKQFEAATKQSTLMLSGPEILSNGVLHYSGPYIKPGLMLTTKKLSPVMQICEHEKIDLIHAHGTYRSGFLAMKLHNTTNIPYVVTSHSDILKNNSKRVRRLNVRHRCKKILKHASAVTHLTPRMAEASHEIFDTQHKSFVIHNGIAFANLKKFTNLPEKNYLLAIGRLELEKGFSILIEAFAMLCKQGVNTSLVIAGRGSAEQILQNKVTSLGLNLVIDHSNNICEFPEKSVIFTGYVRGEEKMRLIAQSKLLLVATQPQKVEEAFGIVFLEGMMAGKMIIASDIYAARYLKSLGVEIKFVQHPDNPALWADAIKKSLENSTNKPIADVSEVNAQFDWDNIARQYQAVYQKILEARRK